MDQQKTKSSITNFESPFLKLTNFNQKNMPSNSSDSSNPVQIQSPFQSVFQSEGVIKPMNEKNEAIVTFMDELFDDELEQLFQEISFEAQEYYDENRDHTARGFQENEHAFQQSMLNHFSPVLNEVDGFMDHAIRVASENNLEDMTEKEFDFLLDEYTLIDEEAPGFEYWGWSGLKKLAKKAVKAVKKKVKKAVRKARSYAKKGWKYAKEKGLAYVMKRLKKYAKGILTKVLKLGIKKLPAKYQGLANTVAKKMGILKEVDFQIESQINFQQEFDFLIAELFIEQNEHELQLTEEELLFSEETYDNSLNELTIAREIFTQELLELDDGQEPEVAIQNFAPAVLAAVKLGLRFYGRDKLIGKIANPISNLIKKYIGKNNAQMLSKLLVDAGFKLFNLELTEEEEVLEGTNAVVSLVEETISKIGNLPDRILQNEVLLEQHLIQAFEHAATAYLPNVLSESTYAERPELKESANHKVAWKLNRVKKGSKKKYSYRKLNQEIETELTPYIANEIRSFNGVSLYNNLKDRMGIVVKKKIPVRIHLFESLPGTNRFHIGKNDTVLRKMGSPAIASQMIHPLTSIASGLLLGEPGLGCKTKGECLASTNSIASHRYYYLEIPGAIPQLFSTSAGEQNLRGIGNLSLKIDFIKNQIQISLFLSEIDAQGIAAHIRVSNPSAAAKSLMTKFKQGIKIAFSSYGSENISLVHPGLLPGKNSGKSLQLLPAFAKNSLLHKLYQWTEVKLADHIMSHGDQLVAAADSETDGVFVSLLIDGPGDLKTLAQFLNKERIQIPSTLFSEKSLDMIVNISAGHNYA